MSSSYTVGGVRILIGDCRQILPLLPAESIQCCVTSPPYWGLRDYEHSDQLGDEETPEEYVQNLSRGLSPSLAGASARWDTLA
ncbi:MAG: DNA methyltransferase [Thermoguttaceae bacterium]|nr:DNA methyltransferase [Thermoguttaceae bacterium]MDW8039784.1 DNA methyltransferase [Thermoguttaceae bacterium]